MASLGQQTQERSSLIRRRCAIRRTGDSTGVIRVRLEPPQAGKGSFSLVLFQILPNGRDSLVSDPAFGVDTFRVASSGLYRLWVRQIGYSPLRDTLRIQSGEVWCPTAHLVPDTLKLKSWP